MGKISVLTNAQIMTLRRMKNGTKYQMTSNGKHGRQVRFAVGSKFVKDDVECKSLAPLMRKGFIKFKAASVCDNGSYYEVDLTQAGHAKVEASYGDEDKP
jgi:hypothetical protein